MVSRGPRSSGRLPRGAILSSFVGVSGTFLGAFWARLGRSWGPLGAILKSFCVILGHPEPLLGLGPSSVILGVFTENRRDSKHLQTPKENYGVWTLEGSKVGPSGKVEQKPMDVSCQTDPGITANHRKSPGITATHPSANRLVYPLVKQSV